MEQMAGERITLAPVTQANWRATLMLGVAPEQQRFIAAYTPIALLALAKAYIRPGGLVGAPFAFYAHDLAERADGMGSADSAVSAGAPVGFALLTYAAERAEVCWLYHFFIDARFQGRGYGAEALQRLLALARATLPGCRAAQLTVHPENQRAQRLYTRAGFRPTGALLDGEPLYRLEWRR